MFWRLMHFYTHLLLLLQPSVQWLSIVNFNDDAKAPPNWILREFDVPRIRPRPTRRNFEFISIVKSNYFFIFLRVRVFPSLYRMIHVFDWSSYLTASHNWEWCYICKLTCMLVANLSIHIVMHTIVFSRLSSLNHSPGLTNACNIACKF